MHCILDCDCCCADHGYRGCTIFWIEEGCSILANSKNSGQQFGICKNFVSKVEKKNFNSKLIICWFKKRLAFMCNNFGKWKNFFFPLFLFFFFFFVWFRYIWFKLKHHLFLFWIGMILEQFIKGSLVMGYKHPFQHIFLDWNFNKIQ